MHVVDAPHLRLLRLLRDEGPISRAELGDRLDLTRPRLLAEVERLFWRAERYKRLVLSTRSRFRESVQNYRRFYDACRLGKPRLAAKVVEDSTQWAVDEIWESLPSEAGARG